MLVMITLENDMLIKKDELLGLIQYYSFLYYNYDAFNDVFPIDGKYEKSIIKVNLFNLIEIQDLIINGKFDEAKQLYTEITLFGNQKNIVLDIIDYYKKHPTVTYPKGLVINLDALSQPSNDPSISKKEIEIISQKLDNTNEQVLKFNNLIESYLEQTNAIKKQIEELPDNIDKINFSNFDLNPMLEQLENKLSKNILTPVIIDFNSSFEKNLTNLDDQMKELSGTIKRTGEYYSHHEKLSLNILENTQKRIIESQNKIIPNLDKSIGDALENNLKSFFDAVVAQVIKNEDTVKNLNKQIIEKDIKLKSDFKHSILKLTSIFLPAAVISILLTGLFVGQIQANKTVEKYLELNHLKIVPSK